MTVWRYGRLQRTEMEPGDIFLRTVGKTVLYGSVPVASVDAEEGVVLSGILNPRSLPPGEVSVTSPPMT